MRTKTVLLASLLVGLNYFTSYGYGRVVPSLDNQTQAPTKPATAPTRTDAGRYYALVIGIDHYRTLPALDTAVEDANAIGNLLDGSFEFRGQVVTLRDASREQILNAISDYQTRLDENSNLLIYYAGHGAKVGGRGYWQPVEADSVNRVNWISSDDLTQRISEIKARHVLIVSDSCYAGITIPAHDLQSAAQDLGTALSRPSHTFMTSGGDQPVRDSGSAGHSVFAAAFLNSLAGRRAESFSAMNVFSDVRNALSREPNQSPQYKGLDESGAAGDFVFFRDTTAASGSNAVALAGPSRLDPSNPESLAYFHQGLELLKAYDLTKAKALFRRAIDSDPHSAGPFLALAQAYYDSAEDENARVAADNAAKFSASLDRDSQHRIEALAHVVHGEWAKAIETYQILVHDYPEDLEYRYRLAEALTNANRLDDAIAALNELSTKAAGGDTSDPRVDLQFAIISGKRAQFLQQQNHAVKSASDAATLHRPLLEAKAYWQVCAAEYNLGAVNEARDACGHARQLADAPEGVGGAVTARGLTMVGRILESQSDTDGARADFTQALRIATDIGSAKDQSGARINLATLEYDQGNIQVAQDHYRAANSIASQIQDKQKVAASLIGLANIDVIRGDYAGAVGNYQRALTVAIQSQSIRESIQAQQGLAFVLFEQGDLQNSRQWAQQSLDASRQANSLRDYALSLAQLGDVLLAQGDVAAARAKYEEARKLFSEHGDKHGTAGADVSLAEVALASGNLVDAEALARNAAAEFESENALHERASARNRLAQALLDEHKIADAENAIGTIPDVSDPKRPQDRMIDNSILITKARIEAARGQTAHAEQILQSILADPILKELQGIRLEARLALLEVTSKARPGATSGEFASLEKDAKEAGFMLIASEAARAEAIRDQ